MNNGFNTLLDCANIKVQKYSHIINVKSKKFVIELEKQVQKYGFLNDFDWWMFSKLDAHLDEVYIPYYNRDHNRNREIQARFYFWLEREDKYYIIFADPKGTKHTDYGYKVDGTDLFLKMGKIEKHLQKMA